MKHMQKQQSSQWRMLLLILLSVFAINACKVTFVANYNADIAKQIEQASKQLDRFYFTMLETTTPENDGRAFDKFTTQYIDIEVELNAILNKNKVRPLNENSTRICEITLELFVKYKNEHKSDNTLSNGLIKLNRKTFSDLFYAMLVAEEGKKIASNPPQ